MTENCTTLECTWGKSFIRTWNNEVDSETPILAIHGWLDNSNSFSHIAPLLNRKIIAIDLPGHGYSDHLPEGNWYHFVDYVVRLNEVVNKLELDKFILMGHSLGAAISLFYAASFPNEVERLVLLDGIGPAINPIEEAPDILQKSIISRNRKRKAKRQMDIETAIKLRMTAGEISHASAESLVKGQIREKNDKYELTFDPKVNFISPLRMSLEHLRVFYKKIECQILLLIAERGLIHQNPYKEFIDELIPNLTKKAVSGGHHAHMDNPEETAFFIESFLNA